jgi:hypothetical protein
MKGVCSIEKYVYAQSRHARVPWGAEKAVLENENMNMFSATQQI